MHRRHLGLLFKIFRILKKSYNYDTYTIRIRKAIYIMKVPTMKTIKEVMQETGLSYRHIVYLCHNDKIVYIKAGKKFLINYEKFIDYLNMGDQNIAS